MRIIAGAWRGRKLDWPKHGGTRPMPDALRETLFNILGSLLAAPGELPALHVADLFAGSGSAGLESLSRGAATCTFFEKDRTALSVLRANMDQLKAGPNAVIVPGDVWRSHPRAPGEALFDLVFLDPPYQDSRDVSPAGHVPLFLERLAAATSPSSRVVLHHEGVITYPQQHWAGWRVSDRRTLGSHAITFFSR